MGRTSDARQRLMDAAYHLICEYSYGAVTIDAICERAAVKKGSFYYFFESKSDLAVAAIDAWWHGRVMVIAKIFNSETPPLERLRQYLDFVTDVQMKSYEQSGQVLGCPLFSLGAEICLQDERIHARILEFVAAGLATFSRTIAEAQAVGDLPPGDSMVSARTMLGVYEGILTLARIERRPDAVRRLSQDVLAAIGASTEPRLGLARFEEAPSPYITLAHE
jgi:TetR/AcrR family transcriptional repressor of nem operon